MSMHGSPLKEEDEYSNQHLTNSILRFPDEIIEMIFSELGVADRCKMRGMNKRLYGIEGRMKKLENRKKLEIIGEDWQSSDLTIIFGKRNEKVSLDEAILRIHRFSKIFKFKTVVFSPSQKEHLILLDNLTEVTSDLFRIAEWEFPNQLAHLFDRSTVCKVMEMAGIVKILRVCAPVKTEDLLFINEIAQTNANFSGVVLRIPRNTARDFVKNILGEADKMSGVSWIVKRNEGRLEMTVRRNYGNIYKFSLYNSKYESEKEKDDDCSSVDSYEDCWCHGYGNTNPSIHSYP